MNVVSLAIFSWDKIEPVEGAFTFEWLDHVIDRLGRAGIAVDLASATAAAPLWLYESHPEVLPVDRYGHTVNAGSRQSAAHKPGCSRNTRCACAANLPNATRTTRM